MSISDCNLIPHSEGGNSQIYDIPMLATIIQQLNHEFEDYKYTVYRCAAKFVALQKVFFTSNIPYKLILAVMERQGICDGDLNLMVPPFQLTALIHDIYYACEKLGHFTKFLSYSVESATALLCNFFWNVFDPHRRHSISLLEIKISFLLLSKLYASDKIIEEYYNLLKDKQSMCVSKLNFETLLKILAKIFSYIGEGVAYGLQNVQLVMDQCYTRCYNLSGLSEYQFNCLWTTNKTRFLIYANLIALIKRIDGTEKLIHLNVCASCKVDKITGIRFKCQSCKNLSLCLKCFAYGYIANKHTVSHRMYEVFTEDIPTNKMSHYISKLCTSLFCFSKSLNKEEPNNFCNVNETLRDNETQLSAITTKKTSNASAASALSISRKLTTSHNVIIMPSAKVDKVDSSLACLTSTASNAISVSEKLQVIINKLLQQNKKLEIQLKYIQTSTEYEISRFLSEHQRFLVDIITEMRNFSHTSAEKSNIFPTSSTPNRSNFVKTSIGLDNFSAVLNSEHISSSQQSQNSQGGNLTLSINGADINRSYLEANNSGYSLNDISSWFHQRRLSSMHPSLKSAPKTLGVLTEVPSQNDLNWQEEIFITNTRETEMTNFKLLLNKVKEIVEDSYSDNKELSEATQNLENVLDSIINTEECRRNSLT